MITQEEQFCPGLADQLGEENLENRRPFLFILFYFILFYFICSQTLESERCLHPHDLTVPSYKVDWLEPFTLFDFSVTPYTYWGKAPTTSVYLRAPEGGTCISNPSRNLQWVLGPALCQDVELCLERNE